MFNDSMLFLYILGFFILLLLCVAYLTLFERKVIAYMQLRQGPNTTGPFGFLQPIADGIKLLHKETIFPSASHKPLFFIAPVLLFTLSFSAWAVIPFQENLVFANLNVGILYLLAISSMNVYSLVLAGWSSGSRYAFLGALRSIAQMISYEVSMGLIVVCIILCAGSLNLTEIVKAQENLWYIVPLFPLWVIFFISCLAETNRSPFDLPESEAELVAGYNVEYSAFTYALFYLGEYANMILMSGMTSILFLGGWQSPWDIYWLNAIPGTIWFLAKVLFCLFVFIWARATLPRYRYDQLMRLGWKVFLPFSLVWVALTAGYVVYYHPFAVQ